MTYESVMHRVAQAESSAGRAGEVTVVAVSKTKSVAEVQSLYDLGHRDFGENRAQEMAAKVSELPDDIRWHFVGSLQSNKARLVRNRTSLLHSMDRMSLASAWLKGAGLPPPVMIQVNVDEEPQKSGIAPHDVLEMVDMTLALGLDVTGLMAIPTAPKVPEDSRNAFATLRALRDEIVVVHPQVSALSMGMTDDFEVAIAEGASFIRVGRAIFGARKPTGD